MAFYLHHLFFRNGGIMVYVNNLNLPHYQLKSILRQQAKLYEGTFYIKNRWRWIFRDDCRYRWNRLTEFLIQIGFAFYQKNVFEIGFGTGDLLFLFPSSCKVMGAELSKAAIEAIKSDPRIKQYSSFWFEQMKDDGSMPVPPENADIILCSHVLEHVPDDAKLLEQAVHFLKPGGFFVIFVPLEPAGFDPKHVRNYSPDTLKHLFEKLGLEILHQESNYHICFGPFRWMDHPARYNWPVLKGLEGIRNLLLTLIPYKTTRAIEEILVFMGIPAAQAMIVGRKSL
jgi:SAM-dependent methyltransferase